MIIFNDYINLYNQFTVQLEQAKIDLKKEIELWNKATVFARIGDPLAFSAMIHSHTFRGIPNQIKDLFWNSSENGSIKNKLQN